MPLSPFLLHVLFFSVKGNGVGHYRAQVTPYRPLQPWDYTPPFHLSVRAVGAHIVFCWKFKTTSSQQGFLLITLISMAWCQSRKKWSSAISKVKGFSIQGKLLHRFSRKTVTPRTSAPLNLLSGWPQNPSGKRKICPNTTEGHFRHLWTIFLTLCKLRPISVHWTSFRLSFLRICMSIKNVRNIWTLHACRISDAIAQNTYP